jgi:gluconolactonase
VGSRSGSRGVLGSPGLGGFGLVELAQLLFLIGEEVREDSDEHLEGFFLFQTGEVEEILDDALQLEPQLSSWLHDFSPWLLKNATDLRALYRAEGKLVVEDGSVVFWRTFLMRFSLSLLAVVIVVVPLVGRADEEAIFAPGASLKVEAGGGAGGEGPAWHPRLGVLSSGNDHIYQLDPTGKSRIWRKDAGTNGLLFDRKGQLLACDSDHRRMVRIDPEDGKLTVLTDRYQGKRYNTPNDLTLDSRGRIYFSDPRYGDRKGMEILDEKGQTIEGVYRIDPDGKVTRILGRELERPNGVLVSADDRYLYVADNNNDTRGGARKLWRFDLKSDGTVEVGSKKLLYDWGTGRGPDGLKQDQKGRLYVAAGLNKPNPPFEPAKDVKGGIYVLSPEGKRLAFLPVPTDEVTNCAFGGEDHKTLYITGGGTLYSIRTTTPGRLVWPEGKK